MSIAVVRSFSLLPFRSQVWYNLRRLKATLRKYTTEARRSSWSPFSQENRAAGLEKRTRHPSFYSPFSIVKGSQNQPYDNKTVPKPLQNEMAELDKLLNAKDEWSRELAKLQQCAILIKIRESGCIEWEREI